MTDTQAVNQNAENKPSDKELNFRALEAKARREIEQERNGRLEAERQLQEALSKKNQVDDEDDDEEPYVDKKKLKKQLSRFGEEHQQKTQQQVREAVNQALIEERKNIWIRQNPDFNEVLNNNAQRFYEKTPKLAEGILKIPDEFERQKAAYETIKELGLDKPEQKQPSIQEKIDANRRSPYYQPSGVGTAPYAQVGDFSAQGKKQAYEKMQQLKSKYGM